MEIILLFYGLVYRKGVFSESSHRIWTNLDINVEILEVKSSFPSYLFPDEDFVDFLGIISCFRVQILPILYNFHFPVVGLSCW